MKTTDKAALYTMGATAGAAVGTFFAGRSMWRGINKAKPIGLLVLAIVAYHTFDSYRESVDTAWGKAENVVERRAATEAAQKRVVELEAEAAAKTAAAAKAKVEADARDKAKSARWFAVKSGAEKPTDAEQRAMKTVFDRTDQAGSWCAIAVKSQSKSDFTRFEKELDAALADITATFLSLGLPPSDAAQFLTVGADIKRQCKYRVAQNKPKPVAKPKINPDEVVVEAKPAPVASEPAVVEAPAPAPVIDKVAEARKALKKAKAVCMEIYRYGTRFCGDYNSVANVALEAAEANLAATLLAN
jgi:hypothetical protein